MPRNDSRIITADCPRCDYPDIHRVRVFGRREEIEFATPFYCLECGARYTDQEQFEIRDAIYVEASQDVTFDDADEDRGFPAGRAAA